MNTDRDQSTTPSLSAKEPAVFSLTGTVRITEAEQLHESALALLLNSGEVTVSCEGAEFVDASILQVLLALKESMWQQGRTLRFQDVPSSVASFWRLAGFDSTLSPRP